MHEVSEHIRRFLAKHISQEGIGDEEDIFKTRHINSLFAMQLVMFIEKQFAIRLESSDLQFANFQSIAAMTRLIEKKRLAAVPVEQFAQ